MPPTVSVQMFAGSVAAPPTCQAVVTVTPLNPAARIAFSQLSILRALQLGEEVDAVSGALRLAGEGSPRPLARPAPTAT